MLHFVFIDTIFVMFGWPMTKSRDLSTTHRPYVTLYDAIYKKGSKLIWVSVSLLLIFFLWNFTLVSKMRNIIIKKKCLLFKHEKNKI